MLSSELTEAELLLLAGYQRIIQFQKDVLLGRHPRVRVEKGMELQAWMQYQAIARAEVMQRYPILYSENNAACEFVDYQGPEEDMGQVPEADLEEVAARKEEATRKVREKLEALIRRQEEAKAIKEAEETDGSTLDSVFTQEDNHSGEHVTDLVLVDEQQCVSMPEEEFQGRRQREERSVVLWKGATTSSHLQQEMTEALKAAKLDEITKRKVHEELLALFRRQPEMQGLKTEVENGLLYDDSLAIGTLDGADDRCMRQIVDVVGYDEGENAQNLELAFCTDIVQQQG